MDLQAGAKLQHFEIVRLIKSGGFGSVYEAQDLRTGHLVALKVLHPENASRSGLKRFEYEAQVLTELEHPNIVRMLEFGNFSFKMPYIAMELLIGRDLRAELEHRGPLSVPEVAAVVDPLCSALHAAHARGIIHRDIKASNVFVTDEPRGQRIVLIDFGVAKILRADALTRSGQLVGTLPYLAPEQVRGAPVDARTDVYGLGALMFMLLSGRMPYQGKPHDVLAYLQALQSPARVSSLVKVPPELDDLILRCMSMSPDDRFASAAELQQALRTALGHHDPALSSEHEAPHLERPLPELSDDLDRTIIDMEENSKTIDMSLELLALLDSSKVSSG